MATSLKSALNGNTGILITTGGEQLVDESLQPSYFTCDALDVLAIHTYGTQNGKKLLMEEWGVGVLLEYRQQ